MPYFTCAIFNPRYRKTVNFAYTEFFVVDVDHISEKELDISSVKKLFEEDKRVLMCFKSPGEDGLKIIFKLREKCYDVSLYKSFYRLFCRKLSEQYGLEQVVDLKTCDVARACFFSYDPEVFYNPKAETIEVSDYIDINNDSDIHEAMRDLPFSEIPPKSDSHMIQDDVLDNIRERYTSLH